MPFPMTPEEEIQWALRRGRPPGRPGDQDGKFMEGMKTFIRERFEALDDSKLVGKTVTMVEVAEEPQEGAVPMPRRKIQVTETDEAKKEPVFSWAFTSSKARGGQIINYETRLKEDGTLSCNCPGWIFAKKNQTRGCKHTKQIEGEVSDILKKFKAGESLPVLEAVGQAQTGAVGAAVAPTSKIRHGRLIEL
jgi:hypothetical protein